MFRWITGPTYRDSVKTRFGRTSRANVNVRIVDNVPVVSSLSISHWSPWLGWVYAIIPESHQIHIRWWSWFDSLVDAVWCGERRWLHHCWSWAWPGMDYSNNKHQRSHWRDIQNHSCEEGWHRRFTFSIISSPATATIYLNFFHFQDALRRVELVGEDEILVLTCYDGKNTIAEMYCLREEGAKKWQSEVAKVGCRASS